MAAIFEAILQFFGGAARVLTWFISAVIIPLVAWFIVLRGDVSILKHDDIARQSQLVEIQNDQTKDRKENTKMFIQIEHTLGEIKGELKRIK